MKSLQLGLGSANQLKL